MPAKISVTIYFLITLASIPACTFAQIRAHMNTGQNIKLLELRNYLLKPGERDSFIHYFEDNFIESQNTRGGYILGQYRVKDAPDHFFWMRGFTDMASRFRFLNDFYLGSFWKAHRDFPNSVLLNNDNVYLLKPLDISTGITDSAFNSNWFGKKKGIAVVNFYISNTKRDQLIAFFTLKYHTFLEAAGIKNNSFWISESAPNDFKALPVFQDPNLMVQISFYRDLNDYHAKLHLLELQTPGALKVEMADLVTVRNTIIILPTDKTFSTE